MATQFVLTDYMSQLMARAVYDKLEDETVAGRIPECKGVLVFGATLRACEDELRSTLEDWIVVGLKLGHPLAIPSNAEYSVPQLRMLIQELEGILCREVSMDEWNHL